MIVTQYDKHGNRLYKDSILNLTQEMQELIDIFWSMPDLTNHTGIEGFSIGISQTTA